WESLRTTRSMFLEPPVIQSFSNLDSERWFGDEAPAVGRLHHKWEAGAPVAERLQVEMMLLQLPIMVEEEHHIGLSAGLLPGQGNRPIVNIDAAAIAKVATNATVGAAAGRRVAVIDSGDTLGKPRMSDF